MSGTGASAPPADEDFSQAPEGGVPPSWRGVNFARQGRLGGGARAPTTAARLLAGSRSGAGIR
ncbi:hypothetical protein EON67_04325 [archaeon]|nr:MAG: hypothetical protein EON67_04325 [archaeon]